MTHAPTTAAADDAKRDRVARTGAIKHWLEINGFQENTDGTFIRMLDYGKYANHLMTVRSTVADVPLKFRLDVEVEVRDMEDSFKTFVLEYSDTLTNEATGKQDVSGYRFVHDDMSITDAFSTSCSRFHVDPEAEYGIPKVMAQLLTNLNDIARNVFRFGRNYEATQKDRRSRVAAVRKALKANPLADIPAYTVASWQRQVASGGTRLGYADWVAQQVESEA